MIYIQIHDDDLTGTMKDMVHYVRPNGDVPQDELYGIVTKQTEELLRNWDYYKRNPEVVRRFYGD